MRRSNSVTISLLCAVTVYIGCTPRHPTASDFDKPVQPLARLNETAPPTPTTSLPSAGTTTREPASNADALVTTRPQLASEQVSTEELFIAYCGACHSLDLTTSQRLDRPTWEWVMTDMIDEYGATWITPEEQRTLIDYLVEHYGPSSQRRTAAGSK